MPTQGTPRVATPVLARDHRAAMRAARAAGLTLSDWVRQALDEYLRVPTAQLSSRSERWISVRLDAKRRARLERYAARVGVVRTVIVRRAIERALEAS